MTGLSASSSGSSGASVSAEPFSAASLTARSASDNCRTPDGDTCAPRLTASDGRGARVHHLLQRDHRGPPGGRAPADRRRLGHGALELGPQVGQGPVGGPPHPRPGRAGPAPPGPAPRGPAPRGAPSSNGPTPAPSASSRYRHTSSAARAYCRGRCEYQLIGHGANPISSTIAQPISVSISRSSARRDGGDFAGGESCAVEDDHRGGISCAVVAALIHLRALIG